MIDCKEAAHLIDKSDFEKLSLMKRLGLRMHLAMCGRGCKGYHRFSHILKSLFGEISGREECLSCEEKEELKKKLTA